MTKTDMVEAVHGKLLGLSKKETARAVDAVLEAMKEALLTEGELKISAFGKFSVRHKAARQGRNPQTGEPTLIAARRVLTFKPSDALKHALNTRERVTSLRRPL